MDEQIRKSFLDKFPDDKHNIITQQFCFAVRAGCKTVAEIIEWVDVKTQEKGDTQDLGEKYFWLNVSVLLRTQDAKDFANYIFWRESLPKEERLKMKYAQSKTYQEKHMEGQEPSEAQLKYLRGLGCPDVPMNKLEASKLIEQWKGKSSGA